MEVVFHITFAWVSRLSCLYLVDKEESMPSIVDADRQPNLCITKVRIIVRAVVWMVMIVAILLPLMLVGCSEDSTGSGGGNYVPRYLVESEPTRTLDGRYIYFIATDTINLGKSGIFRAEVDKPIREMILAGENLHSPTLAPNNTTLAYLNGGIIEHYNLLTGTIGTSNIAREFRSIAWLNDTLLVARANWSIYIVNELRGTLINAMTGWYPSVVTRDTFTYTAPRYGLSDVVIKCGASPMACDIVLTLPFSMTSGLILWPGRELSSDRWVWVQNTGFGMRVHAVQAQPFSDREIDSTMGDKALMLGPDKIIFTGFDGRFWETDWAGSDPFPWWYQEPND